MPKIQDSITKMQTKDEISMKASAGEGMMNCKENNTPFIPGMINCLGSNSSTKLGMKDKLLRRKSHQQLLGEDNNASHIKTLPFLNCC